MLTRIIIGLIALAAVIEGVAPGAVPMGLLPLALAILGLVYGVMCIDAESDATTGFLVLTIAVGGAGMTDALTNIQFGEMAMIGAALDGIMDSIGIALWSSVASIIAIRTWNRLMGGDSNESDS